MFLRELLTTHEKTEVNGSKVDLNVQDNNTRNQTSCEIFTRKMKR